MRQEEGQARWNRRPIPTACKRSQFLSSPLLFAKHALSELWVTNTLQEEWVFLDCEEERSETERGARRVGFSSQPSPTSVSASVSSSVIHSPPWDLNYYCMRKTMTRVQWDSSTKVLIVWDNKSPLWPSNKCYSRSPLHMHLSCIGFHSICGGDIGAQLSPFPLSSILNLSSCTCNEWPCKMRTKSTHSHSILATFLLSKPCQSCFFFFIVSLALSGHRLRNRSSWPMSPFIKAQQQEEETAIALKHQWQALLLIGHLI